MTKSLLAQHVEKQFLTALDRCGHRYADRTYYRERDLVYTIQLDLVEALSDHQSLRVYNDFRFLRQAPSPLNPDLVVTDTAADAPLLLAVEFKYEPDRRRFDITPDKIPVTAWSEIQHDITRVQSFLDLGGAEIAYAVLVDEDGRYTTRAAGSFQRRLSWGEHSAPGRSATAWMMRAS